ncbi:MAG: hypothetical protein H6818_17065 [Phycisphaerales bacterium]|nr:hypothetical protein [Phycisphaerales bacterium]MCB9864991.1 hypothetical protein [Phycisphaerales bacterium]
MLAQTVRVGAIFQRCRDHSEQACPHGGVIRTYAEIFATLTTARRRWFRRAGADDILINLAVLKG